MSSGLECRFVEPRPGEWWYLLQDWSCPVGAWDWREHATAYGPFKSQEEADRHLSDNHANPGGYTICPYVEGELPDDTLCRLMEEAKARKPAPSSYGQRFW